MVELKEELKKRGLHVSGKKAELAERLEEFVKANEVSGRGERATPSAPRHLQRVGSLACGRAGAAATLAPAAWNASLKILLTPRKSVTQRHLHLRFPAGRGG